MRLVSRNTQARKAKDVLFLSEKGTYWFTVAKTRTVATVKKRGKYDVEEVFARVPCSVGLCGYGFDRL